MGKKYPAVQLLSIKNEDNFKMETEICFYKPHTSMLLIMWYLQ